MELLTVIGLYYHLCSLNAKREQCLEKAYVLVKRQASRGRESTVIGEYML